MTVQIATWLWLSATEEATWAAVPSGPLCAIMAADVRLERFGGIGGGRG
jgi:hypothetical protein